MDLDKRISENIKEAMKAKDNIRLETLRAIKSAIMLIKTKSLEKKNLTGDDEINLLQKLVKLKLFMKNCQKITRL